ncbi:MAG: YncE family protein [Desulfobacterales bacterium]|nr:YncE family protein [Desulfobacterales bacterium]
MKLFKMVKNVLSGTGILLAVLAAMMVGTASAKSVYVIASWDSNPNPINAYDIQGGLLAYQSTGFVPYRGVGAMGLALDTDSKRLFVTYEYSNIIEMIDAETFDQLGSQAAAGAYNLAGIVVDQAKGLVYAVDRGTLNLYVYDVATFSLQAIVTLPSGNGSYGIALDGDNLVVGDFTTTVRWYNTTTWAETSSILLNYPAVDVAVDIENRILYATHYTSVNILTKYDLNTMAETSVSVDPNQARGVDVDQATGLVYVTVGEAWATNRSEVRVYTSALTLSNIQLIEDDATGLVVPVEDISYGQPVFVDIKPGSCPNPLNLKQKGVLPVAILGTEEFDVASIDPATIRLSKEGVEGEVAPLRWSYEDVATPFEGELCDCSDLNGDGYMDLTLKFKAQDVVDTLELDDNVGETIPLTLKGNLVGAEEGTPIQGQDCVWINMGR